ncbi:MAG: type VI secretion system ATPase TssH, partial [Clostridia bacterium]|nr:type VI secretion system ATPase TssH [Clostridia bacterium]
MNLQKFTQKSIEAVQNAQSLTIENSNQQMEQVHLLSALTKNPGELVSSVLTRCGVSCDTLSALLSAAIDALPKVSGGGVEADKIYISRDVEQVLNRAEKEADSMRDDFVSVEHILLALIAHPDKTLAGIFRTVGVEKNAVMEALQSIRGNQRVTNDNPEGTYDVLLKYGQDLVELARAQKLDPVIGRDDEIRGVIQILSRKTKNNP